MPSSQKSENITNGQIIPARFINSQQPINKLVMLLMLFRRVAIICVYDLFCKRKQGQGFLYRGTTVQAWEQNS